MTFSQMFLGAVASDTRGFTIALAMPGTIDADGGE
jgi:hypothetical protein